MMRQRVAWPSAILYGALSLAGCEPERAAEMGDHAPQQVPFGSLPGTLSTAVATRLEHAYADAVKLVGPRWAEHVNATAGFADVSETGEVLFAPSEMVLEHMEMRIRLRTPVATPHFQVAMQEREIVQQQDVNSGKVDRSISPQGQLMQACRATVSILANPDNAEMTAALTGDPTLIATDTTSAWPRKLDVWTQQCTVYKTTSPMCLQGGGHPYPSCHYETVEGDAIEQEVVCYLDTGRWRCDDIESPATQPLRESLPQAAELVATELNGAP